MSQIQSGSEATAAALVGSLATFSLFDVLNLLARTGHTGELQVVGRAVDQRVWVDQGDLLDPSGQGSNSSALFELACVEEGWFYFTLVGSVPEGHARVPVVSILAELGPQVEEWRNLVAFLPFDARVSMSASTPGPAVQIRSDQWQLLSLVGNPGRTVRAVVDAAETHPLDTLRTLRELVDAHLVSLVLAAPSLPSHTAPSNYSAPGPFSAEPGSAERAAHATAGAGVPDEEAPEHEGPAHEGLAHEGPAHEGPAHQASTRSWSTAEQVLSEHRGEQHEESPVGNAAGRSEPATIPPAPEGFVERDESVEGPLQGATSGERDPDTAPVAVPPSRDQGTAGPAASSAMPPPITGDPWSSSQSSADHRSAENG